MTAEIQTERSAIPAWGRFLLRIAAIAWPVLTYWYMATTRSSPFAHGRSGACAPVLLALLLPVLTVLGVVSLVCAANLVGLRQRRALAAAAATGIAWIIVAAIVRWVVSETACSLF